MSTTTVTCPTCGHQSAGKRFCPGCGSSLEASSAPPAKPETQPAASRHARRGQPSAVGTPDAGPYQGTQRPKSASAAAPSAPLPTPLKAALVAAAGPASAFAVAALTMAFAPDASRVAEASPVSSGVMGFGDSPLRQGAVLALTSMGGAVVSADGDVTTRVSLMTLLAVSIAVTAMLARRLGVPAWTQGLRGQLPVVGGLVGGALGATILLAILTGGAASTEAGEQSATPSAALLIAPLMALAATMRWETIQSSRARAWLYWVPGVCRGLLVPASLAGIAWSMISSSWVVAGDTYDNGLQPGLLLFDSLLHILNAGTLILWSALALLGAPVQTGPFGSPFGTELTNEVSALSTAETTGVPGPLLVLLVAGIILTALLSASTIFQREGADPHLVWRIPLILAPTAAVLAALSSWSWAGGEFGGAWDYALIIAAAWGAVVGALCHPAVAPSITASIPPLSWPALARPSFLAAMAAVGAGLIIITTVATGIIQSRTSTADEVLNQLVTAYQHGDSASASRLIGRTVVAGTPSEIAKVTRDANYATIDADVDGEPVSITAGTAPRRDRQFGILVQSKVTVDDLPAPSFGTDSTPIAKRELPQGLTVGGLPAEAVRAVMPGATSVTLDDQRFLQLSSDQTVISADGSVPLTFSLAPRAVNAISDSLYEQASRCAQGVCRGAMDEAWSPYYFSTGRSAAIVPTTWTAQPSEVTPTSAIFDVRFSWIDDDGDRSREDISVTLPLKPAFDVLEGQES